MQSASMFKLCSSVLAVAVLLGGCQSSKLSSGLVPASASAKANAKISDLKVGSSSNASTDKLTPSHKDGPVLKTEEQPGEVVGEPVDCDGDGITDESQIDFDGDGASDECVEGVEAIPEPPFQQTYTPTSDDFNRLLPAVGWDTRYQCGDGLYEVTLSRPTADEISYRSQGLVLTTPIVYDDLDPNLNQPLIVREPESGIRYAFTQDEGDEFYEYAIADYSGNVGLYVYQTGEQIVAAPCEVASQPTSQP